MALSSDWRSTSWVSGSGLNGFLGSERLVECVLAVSKESDDPVGERNIGILRLSSGVVGALVPAAGVERVAPFATCAVGSS